MVNDSPWSCHQVDHPSWLFRRWPLLEWSSTSPKPHSYPPSILTATHWMLLNDHKKSYCWTFHCSFRYFLTHIDAISASLPRLSMSCRLWVAVIPTIRKASTWLAPQIHSIQLPLGDAILSNFASDSLQLDLCTCSSSAHGLFQTCPFHVDYSRKTRRPEGYQITLSGLW